MKGLLLFVFLLFCSGSFAQSAIHSEVMSPKPSISINGVPCNIGNLVYSCTPKSCDSLVITEGDSIEFCTYNEIFLNTDSLYYMQWNFTGCSNFPPTFYDSFPNPTPLCYYPKWTVAGNYIIDIYYNGWLSAYSYSDCWTFGPSHWIIKVIVLPNVGIQNETFSKEFQCTVFPNPGSGIFNLKISHPESVTTLFVTDILGEIILSPGNVNQIDLSEFPNGIYFLNFKTEVGIIAKMIVKN